MTDKRKKKVKRSEILSLRLTPNEKNFLEEYVEREGMKLTTYLRSCAMDYALRDVEDEKVMDSIEPENRSVAKETFHKAFDEFEEGILKTIDKVDIRLMKIEKYLETFMYVYLYHTPEVPEDQKKERAKFVKKQEKKVKEMVRAKYLEGLEE